MTVPSVAFGIMFALLIGSLFHVWADGGAGRLLLYMALSAVGFFIGQIASMQFNLTLIPVGALNLGPAIVSSLLFLGMGRWLSPGGNHAENTEI